MEPFKYQDVSDIPYFSLNLWEKEFPHLVAGFSARNIHDDWNDRNYALHVGDLPAQVIQNRKQLAEHLGMSLSAWTCGEQVHGTQVQFVAKQDRGKGSLTRDSAFQDTDGMITGESNLLLASYYADCVPLYFYSPDVDLIGVAHAGWKGTVGGIGVKMVHKLVEKGAELKNIRVAIGPSIGFCCYEVDGRVIQPLKKALGDDSLLETVAMNHLNGKWQLDLKLANAELIKSTGVQPEHLVITKWCTSCDSDYFYSHRRDQGKTGRMVAWIGKKERGS